MHNYLQTNLIARTVKLALIYKFPVSNKAEVNYEHQNCCIYVNVFYHHAFKLDFISNLWQQSCCLSILLHLNKGHCLQVGHYFDVLSQCMKHLGYLHT